MPRLGTSEADVYDVNGRMKLGREVDLICRVCEFSPFGPHRFRVHGENSYSVALICPNCGTQNVRLASDLPALEFPKSSSAPQEAPTADKSESPEDQAATAPKRSRGRPKGSKNKPK